MTETRVSVAPFEPEDLLEMTVQAAQAHATTDWLALGRTNAAAGRAFTARRASGEVLLCGGAIEVHAGYATLWAVFAHDAGPAIVALTRVARRVIALLPHARIDAMVRMGHPEGHRWAQFLGLSEEATLAGVFPDGSDARIYRLKGRRIGGQANG